MANANFVFQYLGSTTSALGCIRVLRLRPEFLAGRERRLPPDASHRRTFLHRFREEWRSGVRWCCGMHPSCSLSAKFHCWGQHSLGAAFVGSLRWCMWAQVHHLDRPPQVVDDLELIVHALRTNQL